MPCQVCRTKFIFNPCQETLNSRQEAPIEVGLKSLFDQNLYEDFKEKCPCKECLIKIVCYDSRMDCFNYLDFLRNRAGVKKRN
jgi:hypothetical protein